MIAAASQQQHYHTYFVTSDRLAGDCRSPDAASVEGLRGRCYTPEDGREIRLAFWSPSRAHGYRAVAGLWGKLRQIAPEAINLCCCSRLPGMVCAMAIHFFFLFKQCFFFFFNFHTYVAHTFSRLVVSCVASGADARQTVGWDRGDSLLQIHGIGASQPNF